MTRSTEIGKDRPCWVLYRIDDNGNEVEMRRFTARAEAEEVMRTYEARGHKQAYLVREEHGTPAP
ncbi:hypothetical protein D3C78_1612840 [compost metagenome]